MRIGINAQLCSASSSYRNAGISMYIRNLVRALGSIDHGCGLDVFLPGSNRDAFPAGHVVHREPGTENPLARIAWEQFVLPGLIGRLKLDVLHSPMHVLPAVCPSASVVTVLDLAFIRYPETFPGPQRRYLDFCTRRAVRKADAVIAISESTKQDIVDLIGCPADRIFTTPLAADASFAPVSAGKLEEVKRRYGITDATVLYVGTLEPRKNILRLLDAFAEVRSTIGSDCRLVLGGGKGWLYDEVFARAEARGLKESVRFVGYVPGEDLPALYASARVFVYPSLYEGFGLPSLEAMACGTPVITSNTSSLPEVVGDAGITVDPRDTEQLADSMLTVLTDDDLARGMCERGLRRAAEFSWQRTAAMTLEVYREAARYHG